MNVDTSKYSRNKCLSDTQCREGQSGWGSVTTKVFDIIKLKAGVVYETIERHVKEKG